MTDQIPEVWGTHNFDRKHRKGEPCGMCEWIDQPVKQSSIPSLTTCDDCHLPYYQTSAPHVCAGWTKGGTMTSTTKGQQLTKEAADLIMAKVHEGKTIDEAVKELTTANTEHEPVARGGEWFAEPPMTNGADRRFHIRSTSDPNGDCVAHADTKQCAEQIVTEHNQHHSLLAERERLREALRQIADSARKAWLINRGTVAGEQCATIAEQANAALDDQKGVPSADQKGGEG